MPIQYSIDETKNIMHLRATGETTIKEWMDIFLEIKGDPKRKLDTSYLLDFSSHATPVPMDYIYSIAKRVERRPTRLKWAFIIAHGATEERIRQFQAFVKLKNIEIGIFNELGKGSEWLGKD